MKHFFSLSLALVLGMLTGPLALGQYPGWQQQVSYDMNVVVDTATHQYRGDMKVVYTNKKQASNGQCRCLSLFLVLCHSLRVGVPLCTAPNTAHRRYQAQVSPDSIPRPKGMLGGRDHPAVDSRSTRLKYSKGTTG